jgi:hypothetical protein
MYQTDLLNIKNEGITNLTICGMMTHIKCRCNHKAVKDYGFDIRLLDIPAPHPTAPNRPPAFVANPCRLHHQQPSRAQNVNQAVCCPSPSRQPFAGH